MNRVPPSLYVRRCTFLFSLILILQFIHLNFIAKAKLQDNLVWVAVAVVGMCLIWVLKRGVSVETKWPKIHVGVFLLIYLLAFSFVLVFSRLPYIISYWELGLYGVRENTAVGGGGWYSAITLLFYPLCAILAFVDMPRKRYYIYSAPMLIIVLVDFVFLGTRNAPVMVLLFHVLNFRVRFNTFRSIFFLILILILFVILFDYQSKGRSLDTVTVGWRWADTLRYSWLMEHLPISEKAIGFLDENLSFMLPVVFLMQYLSHSVCVFSDLLIGGEFGLLGNFSYLYDQYCVIGLCNREVATNLILDTNREAGLYQTLYSSLLFDFGWLGLFCMLTAFISIKFFSSKHCEYITGSCLYFPVILATSSVENYFYNGLGLWRGLAFLMLLFLLSNIPTADATKSDLSLKN